MIYYMALLHIFAFNSIKSKFQTLLLLSLLLSFFLLPSLLSGVLEVLAVLVGLGSTVTPQIPPSLGLAGGGGGGGWSCCTRPRANRPNRERPKPNSFKNNNNNISEVTLLLR